MFNIFSKPKCQVCLKEISFSFTIAPLVVGSSKRVDHSSNFCFEHFLEEFKKTISDCNQPLVFTEPLPIDDRIPKYSQSVFYNISELLVDNFSTEDQQDINEILTKATKEKPIVWLPKETIFPATSAPLVKIKDSFSIISQDNLMNWFENSLANYSENKKGEYCINLPHDDPGVYIYYDYI